MEQLKLTKKELRKIGFTKKIYPGDDYSPIERITYEIETINGCFYYNMDDDKYRWYHKTIFEERSNHIHLNIERLPELFMVLSCFKVKYNLDL